jgi:hypothetical protein
MENEFPPANRCCWRPSPGFIGPVAPPYVAVGKGPGATGALTAEMNLTRLPGTDNDENKK